MRWWHLKVVVNLATLATPVGLLIGLAGGARLRRGPRGLVIGSGYRLGFPVARAFTVGNVIVSRLPHATLTSDPQLLAHEERHTWQYVALLGLPMLPLYALAAGWSLLWTGNVGTLNPFERLAGLADGGYPTAPPVSRPRRPRRPRRLRRPRRPPTA